MTPLHRALAALRFGLLWLGLLWLGLLGAAAPPAKADDGVTVILRGPADAERAAALLDTLRAAGRPVTIRWEEPAGPAAPPPAAPPPAPALSAPAPAPPPAGLWEAFLGGLDLGIDGLARLPALAGAAERRWRSEADPAGQGLRVVGVLALAAAAGFAARTAVARVLPRGRSRRAADLLGRFHGRVLALAAGLAGAGAFLIVGRLAAGRLLADGTVGHRLADGLVSLVLSVTLYALAARFLLRPGEDGRPLLDIPHPDRHRRFLLAYGVAGALLTFLVRQSHVIGEPLGGEGLFLAGGMAITALKLAWFWTGRRDITTLFRGPEEAGALRRFLAALLPWFFMAVAVAILAVAFIATAAPENAHWGYAAGITQVLVLVVPVVALGADALLAAALDRWLGRSTVPAEGGEPATVVEPTPLRVALAAVARSVTAVALWLAGAFMVARVWNLFLRDGSSAEAATALAVLLRVGATLAAGWVLWTFLRAYAAARAPRPVSALPSENDGTDLPVQGRFATVLPLLRDLGLGVIVAVTGLIALSTLGVDIGPLLAGFGVIGLAISFGSQALVRDIVSGIFFMTDDAFRLGEYIETGSRRGTVESITLRSVRLRHQNGPIHTIPFGQLQAVTNYSRDWATMKFEIRLDRDADVEKTRKVIKKVGQRMQEDPEIGPEFLQPLKMQGIADLTETAIVARLKFTAKPGNPTHLRREALKRIHAALTEAGIELASNAVTVRGGDAAAGAGAFAQVPAAQAAAPAPVGATV